MIHFITAFHTECVVDSCSIFSYGHLGLSEQQALLLTKLSHHVMPAMTASVCGPSGRVGAGMGEGCRWVRSAGPDGGPEQ